MLKCKNIAILISGTGTNFIAIKNEIDKGNINGKIVAVISNKKCLGIEKAKKFNLNSFYINHKNFKTRDDFDNEVKNILINKKVDLIVLAGFMRILGKDFVRFFKNKIINIHPSLLPKYKGLNTHFKVLENKDKKHGSTVHIVNENLDDGKILEQKSINVLKSDTLESLELRIKEIEHKLYPKVIAKICSKIIKI